MPPRVEPAETVEHPVPRLAAGTELIGEYQGSGFREPRYLARRSDGQVVQLSHVLYRVATHVDGRRDLEQVASRAGEDLGRAVSTDQVEQLLEVKLRPAGLIAGDPPANGTPERGLGPRASLRPDPLFFLRFRVGLVSEAAAWRIAAPFRFMFRPAVLAVMLACFVALDLGVLASGALAQVVPSAQAIADQPTLILFVLASFLGAGFFHECGHVTACRYGGARPGVMGVGVYLVWPALFSTVTDAYRLSRRARLRVDLAGVYFNAVVMAGLAAAHLLTGSPWLLIALVLMHMNTVWQFVPSIRLDGYYILSDLIGVPDLFSRLGPIVRSLVPWRAAHPRVRELKPWARWVVTAWVVLVIPFLMYFLVAFVAAAPRVLPAVHHSLLRISAGVGTAWQDGHLATVTLGVVQMVLLVLPWLGVSLILGNFARRFLRRGRRAAAARRHARAAMWSRTC